MSELISGKEALIALANGEEVECKNDVTGMEWCNADGLLVKSFFDPTHMWGFRLKPRTITINAPKHTAQHISGRKVEITFESHNDASVFFNEMHEVMLNDH